MENEQETCDRRKRPIQSAKNNLILFRLNRKECGKKKSSKLKKKIFFLLLKDFIFQHSFLLNLSRIKFLFADWIGSFSSVPSFLLVSHLVLLPPDEAFEQSQNKRRGGSLPFFFYCITRIYIAVCPYAISYHYDYWIFSLELPDSCHATSFGMISLKFNTFILKRTRCVDKIYFASLINWGGKSSKLGKELNLKLSMQKLICVT